MSIYPSPDKLDALESKYALVILAAKRARQIKDNARRLVESRSANPLTAALEEIAAGEIVPRIVEDPTVAAHQAALKPNEPSLEDIIGAGPVLAIEPELDSASAQLAALRSAEPDADEDELTDEAEDGLRSVDAFALDAPELVTDIDEEEEDLIPELDEEEE
jgi:DNA-directed RNA polymerase subunit omega